jgi:preprotein translocase subunit SecF
MTEFFTSINVDWMGKRKMLVAVSVVILLGGLFSAIGRQFTPEGTDAFNLGVDFKGGTVVTAKFRQIPEDSALRAALQSKGLTDSVIQNSTDKKDEILIKIPILTSADGEAQQSQVEAGRTKVKEALDTFGTEAEGATSLAENESAAYKIVGTDSVGPVAGAQLRNQAVAATLLGLIGILLFIAFRYDWTYAAGAVIAVLHDVLVTLAFFSIFQWEINLTVIASLLTLVGFSVNDSIVIFDRIRENLGINRTSSIYQLTNDAINQTMSRTIITGGLVFLSVLALVLFGGEVLRASSLALFVGVITGTFSTIAIASPIAIWWQDKIGAVEVSVPQVQVKKEDKLASAARRSVKRRTV